MSPPNPCPSPCPSPSPTLIPAEPTLPIGFDHEKLDVYNVSIEFVELANRIANVMPTGHAYLADQLRRASTSIALNIAEGAGEFARNEKARFYRMARRSATECAAILDVARSVCVPPSADDIAFREKGRDLLSRIVAMLVQMARSGTGPGSGSGAGQRRPS